ncbi:hypothetical protein [Aquimarina rhabdastrellae]
MKLYNSLVILLLFKISFVYSQIDNNTIMRIPNVTTSERNSITTPHEGSFVYDTNQNRLYQYTDTGWLQLSTNRGNVYVGAFQISSAGSLTISDLPFQPSSITFSAAANVESFNLDNDNGTGNNDRGIRNSFGSMTGFARNDSGTITQQVIFIGAHGNSINDISRYASNTNAIGIRYGDQNGNSLGRITASLTSFNTNGFTLNVVYTNGTVSNTGLNVNPTDINNEGLIVLYTAYR